MNLLQIIESLRRHLKTVVLGCYAVLILTVVADVVRWKIASHEVAAPADLKSQISDLTSLPAAHGFWASLFHVAETVPVFWTIFGFLGCVLLVIVSKAVVGPVVSKDEDFYDE